MDRTPFGSTLGACDPGLPPSGADLKNLAGPETIRAMIALEPNGNTMKGQTMDDNKGRLKPKVLILAILLGGTYLTGFYDRVDDTLSAPAAKAQAPVPNKPDDASEKEEQAAALDQFGDPLPAGAIARMGTTRFWCGDAWQIVYSPDGSCIVIATWDEVFLLNSQTGKHIGCIRPVGNSRINSISLSPDGKALAMGTGGGTSKDPDGIQIFDLANGRLLHQCVAPGRQQYLDACFSPDGKMVASWSFPSKSIHLWNANNGQLRRRWPINSDFGCFTFSKDNKALIIGDEQNILFCDIASGVVTRRIESHPGAVYRLALSPDGKTLAAQVLNKDAMAKNSVEGENSIHFWDVATGKKRNTIEVAAKSKETNKRVPAKLSYFAFSADGMMLFTSSNDETIGANGAYRGTLCAWDFNTAKELRTFESEEFIHRFASAPDGKNLAFIGGGQTVRLLDSRTNVDRQPHSWDHALQL